MIDLKNGLILYHGSYCIVDQPNIDKCSPKKDFGKGFYLTTSKEQAENFVSTSIIKAMQEARINNSQNYGYISSFEFKSSKELSVKVFDKADIDWLHCIAAHRKKFRISELENTISECDVIAGKIADDATNSTLTAYLAGAFGEPFSKDADELCIRLLLPNKLKDQFCFRTQKSIDCLKFIESKKIWLKK